ncbi:hypothetical protein, partial [Shewanella algae]|uniref:hypothetical protein n=1 Tax=Shewanella algae TaxID=38313 RepID=UPI00313BD04A
AGCRSPGKSDAWIKVPDGPDDIDGVAAGETLEQKRFLVNADGKAGHTVVMSRTPTHRTVRGPCPAKAFDEISGLRFKFRASA